ncbi:MAG: hypothetical protein SOZ00_08415 [Tidjanibacter sp.]|nr:hypothetical protein [Tidjanibacter sp.]
MKKSLLVLAFLACSALMLSCDKEGLPMFNITTNGGGGNGGGSNWEVADKDIIGTWTASFETSTMTLFWQLSVNSDGTGELKSGMNGIATYTYRLKEIVANGVTLSGKRCWTGDWNDFSGAYKIDGNQITLSSFSSEFPSDGTPEENFANFNRTYRKQ